MNFLQLKNTIFEIIDQEDVEYAYSERIKRELDIDVYIDIKDEKGSLQLIVGYFMDFLNIVDCKEETKNLLRTAMSKLKTSESWVNFFKAVYVRVIVRKNIGYFIAMDSLFNQEDLDMLNREIQKMFDFHNVNSRIVLNKINGICEGLVIQTRTTISVLQQLTIALCSLFGYRSIEWVSRGTEQTSRDKIKCWVNCLEKHIKGWINTDTLPLVLIKNSPNDYGRNTHPEVDPLSKISKKYTLGSISGDSIIDNKRVSIKATDPLLGVSGTLQTKDCNTNPNLDHRANELIKLLDSVLPND